MNYGLTIYGPFNSDEELEVLGRLDVVFEANHKQRWAAWEAMGNYPGFDRVEITNNYVGDLVIHVYYGLIDLSEGIYCPFHARITESGAYA